MQQSKQFVIPEFCVCISYQQVVDDAHYSLITKKKKNVVIP